MSDSRQFTHPYFDTISNFLDLQKSKKFLSSEKALSDEQRHIRSYAFAAARNIESRIASLPEVLLNRTNLDQINTPLQKAFNEFSAFASSENAAHIQNAGPMIDQAINAASWAIPTSAGARTDKEIEKEISVISSAAQSALSDVSEQRDALTNQISELTEQLAAQDQKITDLSQIFDQKTAEANATSAEISTQYSKLEQKFENTFSGQLIEFSDQFDKLTTSNSAAATELIANLTKHEQDARKIVQVVGNVGVTGNYSNLASTESKQANLWRWITVAFFGSGVLIIAGNLGVHIYKEIAVDNYQPSIMSLMLRVLGGFALALPAFYTARESARHRSNADRAKQTELELASLGPFMELLPEEQKVELRVKLTDSYFGSQIESHDVDSPLKTDDITKVLKAVTDLVSKAKS